MSRNRRKNRDAFTEINITPLTDIFLVLLIIMMVIAPMLDQQGLNLTMPTQHEAEQQEQESKIITVNVTQKGEYTIDNTPVTADGLLVAIKQIYEEKKDGLLIRASEESTHDAVVKVMDAAQTVGITAISVVAE